MTSETPPDAVAFLREQARTLRHLAEVQDDPDLRDDLLALAARCEALASHMSGNGGTPNSLQ